MVFAVFKKAYGIGIEHWKILLALLHAKIDKILSYDPNQIQRWIKQGDKLFPKVFTCPTRHF